MKLIATLSLLATAAVGAVAADLGIDVTLPVECERQTQSGDKIFVHYRGTLQFNGQKFDASTYLPLSQARVNDNQLLILTFPQAMTEALLSHSFLEEALSSRGTLFIQYLSPYYQYPDVLTTTCNAKLGHRLAEHVHRRKEVRYCPLLHTVFMSLDALCYPYDIIPIRSHFYAI